MEITFQNPAYLWYLLSLPLLVASHFYFLRYARYRGLKFANFQALKRVSDEKVFTKNYFLLAIRITILLVLILAASGTIFWYKGDVSSHDFVIALDVSASMTAQDIEPNRMEAAKIAARRFLDDLQQRNIRTQVGVVTFSGTTYIEQFLTNDLDSLKSMISDLDVRREGGTDIAGAVVTATNLLAGADRGKTMILISDGSVTVSADEDDTMKNAMEYADAQKVVIHTLGLGTDTGPLGYLPEYYNISAVFNEESLLKLANSTSGKYYKIETPSDLDRAYREISRDSEEAMIDVDLSYGLLLLALFLIFLEWGLVSTKFRRLP